MQRDMVITFVKHINLPFNPLKNKIIFTKPPFYMANEKVYRWTNLLYVNNLKWVKENSINCLTQTWWVSLKHGG